MRINKITLKNYCLTEFCPFKVHVLIGSNECMKCPYYEGMIPKYGTYKDFILDELFTEGNIPRSELAFVYLKCSHR